MLPSREHPWPVALRPFPEEAIGSWLGRLAAFYQMSMKDFDRTNDLSLPWYRPNVGWLLMPPLASYTVARLSLLARISPDVIEAIQTPVEWITYRTSLPFCVNCLFLNRVDVTAPRWIRAWLAPQSEHCTQHDGPTYVAAYQLERCKNFAAVLKLASEQEEMQRWDEERIRRRDRYLRILEYERSASTNVNAASTLGAR